MLIFITNNVLLVVLVKKEKKSTHKYNFSVNMLVSCSSSSNPYQPFALIQIEIIMNKHICAFDLATIICTKILKKKSTMKYIERKKEIK